MDEARGRRQVHPYFPGEVESGVFANVVLPWHTAHEFTLDFGALEPERLDGLIPCRVVTRVKVPVTVLFDMIKALNADLNEYERSFGEIHYPPRLDDAG